MANEVQVSCSLAISSSGSSVSQTGSLSITRSLNAHQQSIQVIGATEEQIVINADLTTGGYCMIKNLSSTINVTISLASTASASNTVGVLLPGEFILFKPTSTAMYAIAASSTVDISVTLTEL